MRKGGGGRESEGVEKKLRVGGYREKGEEGRKGKEKEKEKRKSERCKRLSEG